VVNGVIHDTYDDQRSGTRCVYGYWSRPEAAKRTPQSNQLKLF